MGSGRLPNSREDCRRLDSEEWGTFLTCHLFLQHQMATKTHLGEAGVVPYWARSGSVILSPPLSPLLCRQTLRGSQVTTRRWYSVDFETLQGYKVLEQGRIYPGVSASLAGRSRHKTAGLAGHAAPHTELLLPDFSLTTCLLVRSGRLRPAVQHYWRIPLWFSVVDNNLTQLCLGGISSL